MIKNRLKINKNKNFRLGGLEENNETIHSLWLVA